MLRVQSYNPLILVALTLAGLFATWQPQYKCVNRYLWAKVLGNLILFTVNSLCLDTSITYKITYSIVTTIILTTIILILTEVISNKQNSYRGAGIVAILATTLGRMSFLGLEHPTITFYIGIVEGCILFGSGLTIGYLAPYLERSPLAFTLSGLWLAQAFFRLGIHLNKAWLEVNWIVPPLIGVIAFLLIGTLNYSYRLRELKRALT